MTDKEKAQAYDKALEVAQKELKQDLHESGVWAIKRIFQQLREDESEDERIRKEIIEVLSFVPSSMWEQAKTNYERCFSYLKKQKEQKPDNPFTPLEGLDAIKAKYYDEGFKNGFDEGVASIEPVEWSEDDEDMLNSCISSIEEAKENRYAYKETDGDTSYDHEIAWLKSLRPVSKESLQSWKPNDEQMRALWSVWMGGDTPVMKALGSLLEDLKKLM